MNIHQVKTRFSNSYVVEYDERLMVVDVAEDCHRQVLGFIEQTLERSVEDVSLVVCTHDDFDHIGGVLALAELCGAKSAFPFASNSPAQKRLNDPFGGLFRLISSARESLRSRAWRMYISPSRDKAAAQQTRYAGGEEQEAAEADEIAQAADYVLHKDQPVPGFDDWQLIHTPGHTWDSCCFYHVESASLISGDTLLGSGVQGRVVTAAIYSNKRQLRRSIHHLEQLNITVVYPGHGSVIRGPNVVSSCRPV